MFEQKSNYQAFEEKKYSIISLIKLQSHMRVLFSLECRHWEEVSDLQLKWWHSEHSKQSKALLLSVSSHSFH